MQKILLSYYNNADLPLEDLPGAVTGPGLVSAVLYEDLHPAYAIVALNRTCQLVGKDIREIPKKGTKRVYAERAVYNLRYAPPISIGHAPYL